METGTVPAAMRWIPTSLCVLCAAFLLLTACAGPHYEPGQVWTYETRPGDEDSRITILKVEEYPELGTVVHVRIDDVKAHYMDAIPCAPFMEPFLLGHLLAHVDTVEVPDFKESYDEWREAFGKREMGLVTVSPAAMVAALADSWSVLEAKLPVYLPKGQPLKEEPVPPGMKVTIELVCDEFGTKEGKHKRLVGHAVHYAISGKRFDDLLSLRQALGRYNQEVTVVVSPGKNIVYRDVAPVVDALASAGFKNIHFADGLGSKKQPKPDKKTPR